MVEINLLPQQYRKQSQPDAWKYATWALLPITAAALLIPWVMTSTKTGDLQRQIDAVQGDIDTLTPQKREHDQLVTRQAELEKTTQIAQTLRDQKTYWSNDLAAFSQQMPSSSGVALTHLTMTALTADELTTAQNNGTYVGKDVRRQMTINGNAASQQAVINFLNTFENSPNFGVSFQNMKRDDQSGQYTFDANVGVVGVAPAAAANTGDAATVTPAGTAPAPAAPAAPAGGTNVK